MLLKKIDEMHAESVKTKQLHVEVTCMVNHQEEIEKMTSKVEDSEYKVDLSLAFGSMIHIHY